MVWYSHLFENFPQFVVIHTVKGFSIVSKAEGDVFHQKRWFSEVIEYLDSAVGFVWLCMVEVAPDD